MSERHAAAAIALVLLLVGAGVAWTMLLRPSLTLDTAELADLPLQLASWTGEEIPMKGTVESMLRADFNLQRVYRHVTGELVWVYVGYYGTDRGGRPEHTPNYCYSANGWDIVDERVIDVDPTRGLRAVELVVRQAGETRLVHFWYQSFRRSGLLDTLELSFDHLVGNLSTGRADGSLIRFSTRIPDGELQPARSRLLGFENRFERLLAEAWPGEHRQS